MNILGNQGEDGDSLKPYYDYTGYKPVNSATNVTDATHWQPAILSRGVGHFGAYVSQQFITPQLRNVKPFSFKKTIDSVFIPPHGRSDKVHAVKTIIPQFVLLIEIKFLFLIFSLRTIVEFYYYKSFRIIDSMK